MHWLMPKYWAILWTAIVVRAMISLDYVKFLEPYGINGFANWLLFPIVGWCCILHVVNCHDCNHLRAPLPAMWRIFGYGLFCSGFLPLAPAYGDVEYQHLGHHVKTKDPLEHDEEDPHSRLARAPGGVFGMAIYAFLFPGHISMEDIVLHQICENPSYLWPERIIANIFHWMQLAALWELSSQGLVPFWPVLISGHIAMFVLWFFFSGLLHHPSWFRFLVYVDKSGMRYVPVLEPFMKIISSNAWLEIKWHDVHHAYCMGSGLTFGGRMAKGMTYQQIDTTCAKIADKGLFLDTAGTPVFSSVEVGHQLGSRAGYLQQNNIVDEAGFVEREEPASPPQHIAATSAVAKRNSISDTFKIEEIAQHNTGSDCWIIVGDEVYDVTKWLAHHPGGKRSIMMYAGKDSTEQFDMIHDRKVIKEKGLDKSFVKHMGKVER
jgi:hypothetical protein